MNYYYLITSLKDFDLDSDRVPISSSEFIQLMKEEVLPTDFQLFTAFRNQYDNYNLVAILENRKAFDARGNFSREQLEIELNAPFSLPQYAANFLDNYRLDQRAFPQYSLEDELSIFYFDFLKTKDSSFIQKYIPFECNLRNVIAALNCRQSSNILEQKVLLFNGEESELLLLNNSGDFGLAKHYDWLSIVLQYFTELDPFTMEKKLALLRLKKIDEILKYDYFGIDRLLGYWWRLNIVERFQALTSENGARAFAEIVLGLSATEIVLENFTN